MRRSNCLQQSPEWDALRCDIPTASQFSRIVTPKKGDYATAASAYMDELIAESLGWVDQFKGNRHTDRGNLLEPVARNWYAFEHDVEIEELGFLLSKCGRYGGSPDGLILGRKPIEIKAPDLPKFITWKREGVLPDEHKVQCHGHMILAESDECVFLAYPEHQDLEPFEFTVKRDAFTETVEGHLKTFCDRLESVQRQILGDNFSKYIKPKQL